MRHGGDHVKTLVNCYDASMSNQLRQWAILLTVCSIQDPYIECSLDREKNGRHCFPISDASVSQKQVRPLRISSSFARRCEAHT
jgi:hypothetical protein